MHKIQKCRIWRPVTNESPIQLSVADSVAQSDCDRERLSERSNLHVIINGGCEHNIEVLEKD